MAKNVLSRLALLFFANVLAGNLLFAENNQLTLNLDQGSGSVEFHATGHPSAIKIVGKGEKPHGNFIVAGHQVTGEAHFELATLNTGIDMRDRHMKEKYLEVQKYPEARLTITKMELPKDLSEGASISPAQFTGSLALHGLEKSIVGTANIKREGNQVSLEAQFSLKIADYGITLPSFAGITMADEVQISVLDTVPVTDK